MGVRLREFVEQARHGLSDHFGLVEVAAREPVPGGLDPVLADVRLGTRELGKAQRFRGAPGLWAERESVPSRAPDIFRVAPTTITRRTRLVRPWIRDSPYGANINHDNTDRASMGPVTSP